MYIPSTIRAVLWHQIMRPSAQGTAETGTPPGSRVGIAPRLVQSGVGGAAGARRGRGGGMRGLGRGAKRGPRASRAGGAGMGLMYRPMAPDCCSAGMDISGKDTCPHRRAVASQEANKVLNRPRVLLVTRTISVRHSDSEPEPNAACLSF